jgi:hypothetical protein
MKAYSRLGTAATSSSAHVGLAALLLAVATIAPVAQPAGGASQLQLRPAEIVVSGIYRNSDYRFAVEIPEGLSGIGAKPPAPNHGFLIRFSADDSDLLSVVADYDVLEFRESEPPDFSRAAPAGYEVLETRRHSTILAGLDGQGVWQRLRRKVDGLLFVTESVGAKRTTKDETIQYSVSLLTPEAQFVRRKEVLDKLLTSFRLLP